MAENTTGNNQRQQGLGALSQHVSTHKLEMGLWATRILTIFFTIAYFYEDSDFSTMVDFSSNISSYFDS